jgi:hypothetical protein
MNIPYLITLLEKKLSYLNIQKLSAIETGNVDLLFEIEQSIVETQHTLIQLQSINP